MKTITVVLQYEEVLELLDKQIRESAVKAQLKELFAAHLSEDYQMVQLYKVLTGISLKPSIKVGETFWVKYHMLSSWKFDKVKMREKKLLVEDCVLCEVIEINQYYEAPLKVKYSYIDDKDDIREDTYDLKESALTLKNEDLPF